MPDFFYENEIGGIIAGVDEAGRGPWAGPVVAGAVIILRDKLAPDLTSGLDDSKKLTPKKRETLLARLLEEKEAVFTAYGEASVAEIDELNILAATMLAMRRAVEALPIKPDFALIDGNKTPKLSCPCKAIVKGDSKSISIAAASIVAKVTRDKMMEKLAEEFPGYGWEKNAGYGTALHQKGLKKLGITPHHRKSFAPIRAYL